MTTRTMLTLGGLIMLGFLAVLTLRLTANQHDMPALQAAAPARIEHVAQTETHAPITAPAARSTTPVASAARKTAPAPTVLGRASGNIHFERTGATPDVKAVSLDFNIRSAVGVWQPHDKVMRILLLEAEPESAQVAQLLNAAQTIDTAQALGRRAAMLELRFIPNAQAFDRNEVDSARLMVSNALYSSSADALAGLDWAGSLPSPDLPASPGRERPTLELTSSGDTATVDADTWKQAWRIKLTVPVVMRE